MAGRAPPGPLLSPAQGESHRKTGGFAPSHSERKPSLAPAAHFLPAPWWSFRVLSQFAALTSVVVVPAHAVNRVGTGGFLRRSAGPSAPPFEIPSLGSGFSFSSKRAKRRTRRIWWNIHGGRSSKPQSAVTDVNVVGIGRRHLVTFRCCTLASWGEREAGEAAAQKCIPRQGPRCSLQG